jgi:hypothetical protein
MAQVSVVDVEVDTGMGIGQSVHTNARICPYGSGEGGNETVPVDEMILHRKESNEMNVLAHRAVVWKCIDVAFLNCEDQSAWRLTTPHHHTRLHHHTRPHHHTLPSVLTLPRLVYPQASPPDLLPKISAPYSYVVIRQQI